ncbi:inorganic diphosphatase [Peijinzhouia sedimentorum]
MIKIIQRSIQFTLIVTVLLISCNQHDNQANVEQEDYPDSTNVSEGSLYRIKGDKNFNTGYSTFTGDSLVNVIIEIPAGTLEKWEVEKSTGDLILDKKDGEYRRVNYLSYPSNYGMVPGTLSPSDKGGDGDPLDIFILGEAIERGSVVACKIIGVIELLDDGERDDKLIAVVENSPFYPINNLTELEINFKGTTQILETWVTNYKGNNDMKVLAISDVDRAKEILMQAVNDAK